MPSLRNYHIFISHSWDYSEDYNTIVDWFDLASNFNWSDYSVPIEDPIDAKGKRDLQDKIDNKIANASCVIVLAGMYSAYSEWIDYEIKSAFSYGKPIIGIKPRGQERVPEIIRNNANIIVGWNSDSVVNAVRDCAL